KLSNIIKLNNFRYEGLRLNNLQLALSNTINATVAITNNLERIESSQILSREFNSRLTV
ncbi:8490_t:CDS:1, partial [Funneliformis caledonium]